MSNDASTQAALDLHSAVARAAVAARAAAAREPFELRQLAVLQDTYPGWDISRVRDDSGRQRWLAVYGGPLTEEMRAANAAATILESDAVTLAATLAWQSALVGAVTATHQPFGQSFGGET
ncbi:hypothetical protein ACIBQX_11100 [Nonomuraea sp. NPDC049714]|uniref:hypothetical protein n=1 Tax=Nonomuraea sp. NPDC049714 TaxID=3364357 RepID=UPI0037ADD5A7